MKNPTSEHSSIAYSRAKRLSIRKRRLNALTKALNWEIKFETIKRAPR